MKKIILFMCAATLSLSAKAAISYTDLQGSKSMSTSGMSTMDVDLDGDSQEELTIMYNGMAGIYAITLSTTDAEFAVDNKANMPYTSYVSALFSGTELNSGQKWADYTYSIRIADDKKDKFQGVGERFVGFRVEDGGDYYYGWMLVEFTGSNFTVKSIAIEDAANTPIIVGDTGSQVLSLAKEDISEVKIYPTLVEQELTVDFASTPAKVEIYNLAGNLMFSQEVSATASQLRVDVSSFANGVYLVSVTSERGGKTSRKLVKQGS